MGLKGVSPPHYGCQLLAHNWPTTCRHGYKDLSKDLPGHLPWLSCLALN